MKHFLLAVLFSIINLGYAQASGLRADIFPGQCQPEISDAILRAYDLALNRKYAEARRICKQLERDYPDNPAGSAGLMTLFQVMMLENDDYAYDQELKAAALRNQAAVERFLKTRPQNSWYYTLAGTSWGIQGIYYLRQDDYFRAFFRGINALRYLKAALDMDPQNWEARMGRGVYLYYRSAYTYLLPFILPDQRAEGIREVEQAGRRRPYLHEVSKIALYYIYSNERDYDRGLAIMKELIAERPDFIVYYQFAGRAMVEKGDYPAAIPYYRRIQELDPSLYLPLFKLGECYFHLGEDKEAKANLEKFLQQAQRPDPSYIASAQNYLKQIKDRAGPKQ